MAGATAATGDQPWWAAANQMLSTARRVTWHNCGLTTQHNTATKMNTAIVCQVQSLQLHLNYAVAATATTMRCTCFALSPNITQAPTSCKPHFIDLRPPQGGIPLRVTPPPS